MNRPARESDRAALNAGRPVMILPPRGAREVAAECLGLRRAGLRNRRSDSVRRVDVQTANTGAERAQPGCACRTRISRMESSAAESSIFRSLARAVAITESTRG